MTFPHGISFNQHSINNFSSWFNKTVAGPDDGMDWGDPSCPDFRPCSWEIGVNGLGRANIVQRSESDESFSHNFNFSASEEFGGFVVNEMRVWNKHFWVQLHDLKAKKLTFSTSVRKFGGVSSTRLASGTGVVIISYRESKKTSS